MSTKIDERVVEMRFDNKHFESNVQTSLSTLDRLKKALNFKDSSKSLEGISAAAKNVNFSGLTGAVETVHAKFSAFEVVAVTALANITNSAVNAGKQIVESLTIEPIHQGFSEYELKMGSVQTIMASTGATLEEVNGYLDELNTYADKTIYSFSDMTNNIGKFTNAGVDLKDAVKAIQGISNEAALSGANANEASRAMYNFAQALSAGAVKLIDWKSIENANMATVDFKQNLIDTAVELGTLTESEGKYKSTTTDLSGKTSEAFTATRLFNESLSSQWMTTEVLVATLGKYSDETTEVGKKAFAAAQDVKTLTQLMDTLKEAAGSGWAQTWELLIGDFDQAKESFTWLSEKIGGIINDSADARNELLSGALSSKKASLADWDSLEKSGLAMNKDFILAVKDAAREHGVAIDQMIEDEGTFRATMKRGWLSHDILTEAFENMSKGVEKTEEYTVQAGDTLSAIAEKYGMTVQELAELNGIEDANMIFTGQVLKLSSALTEATELTEEQKAAYEELNASLGKVSGRELLWESLKNSIEAVLKVSSTLKAAWDEVFSPMTSEGLYGIIESIHEFSQKLIISDETAEKLKRTMKGVFSVFKIVADIVSGALSAGLDVVSGLFRIFGSDLLDSTSAMGDMLVGVKDWIESNEIISNVFGSISKNLLAGIETIYKWIKSFLGIEDVENSLTSLGDIFSNVFGHIRSIFDEAGKMISESNFVRGLEMLWNVVKTIFGGIANALGKVFGYIGDTLKNSDFENFLNVASALSIGGIAAAITKFIKELKSPFEECNRIFRNITGALGDVRECFEAYQTKLKAGTLLTIAVAIGILAGSLIAVSSIEPDRLSSSIGAITMLFGELVGAFAILEKLGSGKTSVKNVTILVGMAIAVAILAGALKKLSDLEWEELGKGLAGVAGLSAVLVVVAKQLSGSGKKVMKGALQLVLFAVAIKILASVCVTLSALSWEELGKGLVGVGLLLAEIDLFLNTAKFGKRAISASLGILLVSAALKVLASVCKDFGGMSWSEIGKGLASIGALLLELSLFTKLTGNAKHMIRTGLSLVLIAASMNIFASAVSKFGAMKWNSIGKGLAAMGGALLEVAIATKLMPKNVVGTGIGILIIAGSLEVITDVMTKIAGLSWEGIAKGLVAIGVSMAEFAIGLRLMKGTASGSAALLVAAAAFAILTPVLKVLGAMSWESIAKGLVAMAGAFVVLGVAGLLLGPLVPAILGLSGAVALLGIGIAAAGIGMVAFGAGLLVVSSGFRALILSITDSGTSIAGLISEVITGLALGIVEFARIIKDGAPDIGDALVVVITEGCKVISECAPQITEMLFNLLISALGQLKDYIPQIANSLFDILIEVINTIASRMPELLEAGAGLVTSIFDGIAGLFGEEDAGALITAIIDAGGELIGNIGDAVNNIISDIGTKIGEFTDGVGEKIGSFFGNIAGGFASGASSHLSDIGSDLGSFMENASPFFEGIKGIDATTLSGIETLTNVLLKLTASELIDAITNLLTGAIFGGESSLSTFGDNLADFGAGIKKYGDSVRGINADSIKSSATAADSLVELANKLPETGGLFTAFTGEQNLATFGDTLADFGAGIKKYGDSVNGLDTTSIITSATAADSLVELANKLPETDGLFTAFTGEKNLGTFGNTLADFGAGIKAYGDSVNGLDTASIITSATAADSLVTLAGALPNMGGLIQNVFGEQNLELFGDNLEAFGTSLAAYAETLNDVPDDISTKTEALTTALTALSESAKIDDGTHGGYEASYLQKFGTDIQNFSGNIADFISIDYTTLDSVKASIEKVIEMIKSTEGLNLDAFKNMGSALSDFGDLDIDNFTEAIEDSAGSISGAANAIIDALAEGVTTGEENSLTTVFNSLITDILAEFVTKNLTFKVAGQALADNLISGIGSKALNITTTVLELLGGAVSTINGYYTNFYDAGAYVVDGFANGISDNTWKAEAKAKAMAKAAKEGAEKELNEHSPSKVFYGIGDFAGQGFVNGLSAYESKSYNAGRDMAAASKAGLGDAISKITDVIDGNIDTTPTIRPVLDLSEIKSGAGTLNTLLTGHRSVGVMANVSAISYGMRGRSNSTDDVVAAIRGLGKDIGNMSSGDTFVVDGVTYDDGSNIASAVQSLVRAAKMERRV